jgi:hypothetical protein
VREVSKTRKTVYTCDLCGREFSTGGTRGGWGVLQCEHDGPLMLQIRAYRQGAGFRLYNGQTDRDLCPDCLRNAMAAAQEVSK